MNTFVQIIEKFGTTVLAELFRVDESHIRTMKTRNSIPPEYWGILIEEGPKYGARGLSWRRLRALRDARFPEKVQAAE